MAIQIRQLNIQQDGIKRMCLRHGDTGRAIVSAGNRMAVRLQQILRQIKIVMVVFDNQDIHDGFPRTGRVQ